MDKAGLVTNNTNLCITWNGALEFTVGETIANTPQICMGNTREAESVICEEVEQSFVRLCILLKVTQVKVKPLLQVPNHSSERKSGKKIEKKKKKSCLFWEH